STTITAAPIIKYDDLQPKFVIKLPVIGCMKAPIKPPIAAITPSAIPLLLANQRSTITGPAITVINTPPTAKGIAKMYQPHTEIMKPNIAQSPACSIVAIISIARASFFAMSFPPTDKKIIVIIDEILKYTVRLPLIIPNSSDIGVTNNPAVLFKAALPSPTVIHSPIKINHAKCILFFIYFYLSSVKLILETYSTSYSLLVFFLNPWTVASNFFCIANNCVISSSDNEA